MKILETDTARGPTRFGRPSGDRNQSCRVRVLGLIGLVLLAGQVQEVSAQRFRAYIIRSSSENRELSASSGLGVTATLPVPLGFDVDLSLRRIEDSTMRHDTVCVNYFPRLACFEGTAVRETSFLSLSAGLSKRLRISQFISLIPAGSLSLGTIAHAGHTIGSHIPPSTFSPGSSQPGSTASLEIAIRPMPSIPFELSLAGATQWVDFNGCAREGHDAEKLYTPFCGVSRFFHLQFGGAFLIERE